MSWKKMLAAWGVALGVGFYTTFVIQNLWNWFAVAAFHVPEISYWTIYGLLLGAHLVFDKDESLEKGEIFGRIRMMLDACVPEEKREELTAELKAEDESMGMKIFTMVIVKAIVNTVALGVGFAIHLLAG